MKEISQNTTSNFTAYGTGIQSTIRSIWANRASAWTITGNIIKDITDVGKRPGTTNGAELIGISDTGLGSTLFGNTIYNLNNTAVEGAVNVYGIYSGTGVAQTTDITRNRIYSICLQGELPLVRMSTR